MAVGGVNNWTKGQASRVGWKQTHELDELEKMPTGDRSSDPMGSKGLTPVWMSTKS
jgi:hypothetical protein